MKEVTITWDYIKLNLLDCIHTLRKCLHQFAHVIMILFVVDLTSFEQGSLDDSLHNIVVENSSPTTPTREITIILLFSKIDAFLPRLFSR